MARIYFQDPSGDNFGDTSLEKMKEFIFEKGDSFWDVGSGEASLNFYENPGDEWEKSFLLIKGLEKYGFAIDHKFRRPKERMLSLREGEHTGEILKAAIGGEPASYFREYFASRETAWRAIEYFMETGERHPELTWEIAESPED